MSKPTNIKGLRLKIYYFAYFMVVAGLLPYLPLYLKQQGVHEIQIGSLMAIGPLVMIIAQPFWGLVSDYLRAPLKVLRFTLTMGMLIILLFYISNQLWWLGLIIALYMFFTSPNVPLADSIALDYLKTSKKGFGSVRLWGSLGFSMAVLLMGLYFSKAGLKTIFVLTALLLSLSLIATIGLPKGQVSARQKLGPAAWKLLTCRPFLSFVGFTCLVQITFNAYNTFFSLYFASLGGNTKLLGVAWMLSALSEIPVFYYGDWLLKRFGTDFLLKFAGAVYGLRWLIYAYLTTSEAVLAAQLLQGISFGLFYLAAVNHANRLTPRELLTTGQSLFAAITFGVGSTFGSIFGGLLYQVGGFQGMFLALAAIILIAQLFFSVTNQRSCSVNN